jgi:hypothetical protein
MAHGYELLQNYKNPENYDYIIRSRLDVVYLYDIVNYVKELNDTPSCRYIGADDQFGIGRPDIMNVYFNLINNFGTYHNHHLRNNFKKATITIENWKFLLIENSLTWRYASLQLQESLFQYCDSKNLDIDTTLKNTSNGYIRRYVNFLY